MIIIIIIIANIELAMKNIHFQTNTCDIEFTYIHEKYCLNLFNKSQ